MDGAVSEGGVEILSRTGNRGVASGDGDVFEDGEWELVVLGGLGHEKYRKAFMGQKVVLQESVKAVLLS